MNRARSVADKLDVLKVLSAQSDCEIFMRSALAATLVALAATVTAAHSQTPKRVQTVTVKPPEPQTPADTAKALADADRMLLQSDLAWVGAYNGLINGEVSDRLVAAIKSFQKDNGGKQTGVLNPQERGALSAAAKALSDRAGWKIGFDPVNGVRIGLPTKLAPIQSNGATGSKWSSAQGQIQIETWRQRDNTLSLNALADREAKAEGRKVDYRAVKDQFFVLSGMQNLKKFYIRGEIKGSEARGMTVLYDQATEGTMAPVVVLMSSAFTAFPTNGIVPTDGPPPRKMVEYSTGVVVSADGVIVADRLAVDGCLSIIVPAFGNADRVAQDKTHDLALLRVYGTSALKPLAMEQAITKPAVTITGIADPQNQGGGAAVSTVDSTVAATSGSGDPALQSAPGIGLSGGAAVDGDRHFAGIALLKPPVVAGGQGSPPPAQAVLVPADAVRDFLKANSVTPASGASDATASVLRVICVRK
jgi:peptidoglycan hydrolase-like protein with peptidoglycan-binding domain